jgi:hypothetical protein
MSRLYCFSFDLLFIGGRLGGVQQVEEHKTLKRVFFILYVTFIHL